DAGDDAAQLTFLDAHRRGEAKARVAASLVDALGLAQVACDDRTRLVRIESAHRDARGNSGIDGCEHARWTPGGFPLRVRIAPTRERLRTVVRERTQTLDQRQLADARGCGGGRQ